MRHATKGLIAAAAAALIASGGLAIAQEGGPSGPHRDPGPHREMGPRHDQTGPRHDDRDAHHGPGFHRGERMIRFLDANHDGKLALDEIKAQEDRVVALADVNGDGALSADEFRRRGTMLMRLRAFTLFDLADANGDGKLTVDEVQAPSERWFKRYDKNNDGFLEADELAGQLGAPPRAENDGHARPSRHATRFVRFLDTDQDGKVSLAEIKGEEARIFHYGDANGDNALSPDEFRRAGMLFMRLRAATLFDLLDANGDGTLTKDEIQAPSERWFARYDSNKDGFLDPDELAQLKGPRGRR